MRRKSYCTTKGSRTSSAFNADLGRLGGSSLAPVWRRSGQRTIATTAASRGSQGCLFGMALAGRKYWPLLRTRHKKERRRNLQLPFQIEEPVTTTNMTLSPLPRSGPSVILILLLVLGSSLETANAATRKGQSSHLRRDTPGKKPKNKKTRSARNVVSADLGEKVTFKPKPKHKGRRRLLERELWTTVDESVALGTASTATASKGVVSTAGDEDSVYIVQITPDIVAGNTVECTATCSSVSDGTMVLNMKYGSLPDTLNDSGSARAATAADTCSSITASLATTTAQTLYVSLGIEDSTGGASATQILDSATVTCTSANTPTPTAAPTAACTPCPFAERVTNAVSGVVRFAFGGTDNNPED